MIQVGQPFRIGVTFDTGGLHVAARLFQTSGPIGAWFALANFDGASYGADYTLGLVGSYAIKKVVFLDSGFTMRDPNYAEADDALQVVDVITPAETIFEQVQSFSAVVEPAQLSFEALVKAPGSLVASINGVPSQVAIAND